MLALYRILAMVPVPLGKWKSEEWGGIKHHTGELPIVKVGRHTPKYVLENWVPPEYGHACIGEECRCLGAQTFSPGHTEDTGLIPVIQGEVLAAAGKTWLGARRSAVDLRRLGVNPWGETEAFIRGLAASSVRVGI